MNLNELWVGTDYAYYPQKGRDERFRWPSNSSYSGVFRVKIIRPFKAKAQEGNERLTGYAEVLYVDNETGEPLFKREWDHDKREYVDSEEHKTGEVRARDIAMRWDEYSDELDHRTIERDKQREISRKLEEERRQEYERQRQIREEQARAAQEERERLAEEKRRRDEADKQAILDYLTNHGITLDLVRSVGEDLIYLDRKAIEQYIREGVNA